MTAVMVGASLGFLPHNVHPARIFMGDSGSMVLGLVFAAAAITVTGQIDTTDVVDRREQIPAFLPILLPLAVVAVPLIDMALAFIRRLGKGQSPFKPDAHHLHHRLLRFGHSHRWAVAVLWLWTFVLAFRNRVDGVPAASLRGRSAGDGLPHRCGHHVLPGVLAPHLAAMARSGCRGGHSKASGCLEAPGPTRRHGRGW